MHYSESKSQALLYERNCKKNFRDYLSTYQKYLRYELGIESVVISLEIFSRSLAFFRFLERKTSF
jgi:hypothetical protein